MPLGEKCWSSLPHKAQKRGKIPSSWPCDLDSPLEVKNRRGNRGLSHCGARPSRRVWGPEVKLPMERPKLVGAVCDG